MPRKARIEYAGAFYHLLNRGNYRKELFTIERSGEMFEKTLFEACCRFGWRLHAYVIMSNHYHLCVETLDANLVSGMQWLQSTFANRFNRLVSDRGHVFQGRYKALLIEQGDSLLRVVNYIHLNPVRAGIVNIESLSDHPLSSFPKFFLKSTKRPGCLENKHWLFLAGNLRPNVLGMRCYHRYLEFAKEANPEKRSELYGQLCRGWYIGTRVGKKALLKDLEQGLIDNEGVESLGFGEDRAESLLDDGLIRLGKTEQDLRLDLKMAPWKITLACWIKVQCGVNNRWFSDHMNMGAACNVSKVIILESKKAVKRNRLWKKLGIPKEKA